MPNEQIIYFGDTAHLPYGDKSPGAVAQYSKEIARFLLAKGVKAIVIACNTASAFGYHKVKEVIPEEVPIINVIDPMARFVASQNHLKDIGIIGTKGTINSNIYPTKIAELSSEINIHSIATPLLAPMVEENFANTQVSTLVLQEYIGKISPYINGLILGCTHYPLLKDDIRKVFGSGIEIFDSSEVTAIALKQELESRDLLGNNVDPKYQFYISDYTESFERNAQMFFGHSLHLKELNIWSNQI